MQIASCEDQVLDQIVWEGGTTLHCVYNGYRGGIKLCFNQKLADGGNLCLTLGLKSHDELTRLISFLEKEWEESEKIPSRIAQLERDAKKEE